jgi:hydrogenase/urease accessory protein HupE
MVSDMSSSAHGVAGGAESIVDFVGLGFTHMLTGWDHLLFITGVVMLAWQPRRAVGLLSLFALGHSITLIAATVAGWRIDAQFVDGVIAVSVGLVGTVGVIGRPRRFHWFGLMVFGFGLVHGLGLATRFQDLAVPEDGLVSRLLAFNVGIEFGQFLVVYLLYLFGEMLARRAQWARIEQAGYALLVAVGLVSSIVLTVARL